MRRGRPREACRTPTLSAHTLHNKARKRAERRNTVGTRKTKQNTPEEVARPHGRTQRRLRTIAGSALTRTRQHGKLFWLGNGCVAGRKEEQLGVGHVHWHRTHSGCKLQTAVSSHGRVKQSYHHEFRCSSAFCASQRQTSPGMLVLPRIGSIESAELWWP